LADQHDQSPNALYQQRGDHHGRPKARQAGEYFDIRAADPVQQEKDEEDGEYRAD
jgi:hypothetical protein